MPAFPPFPVSTETLPISTMAKYDQRSAASVASGCSGRFLPDAAFRRRLVSALLCGGSHGRRKPPELCRPQPPRCSGAGRPLSELFESEPSLEEAAVVADLRSEARCRAAAAEVRRWTRADASARRRIAAAGAIAALVSVVGPSEGLEEDLAVEVLYAILNLGIGNDANKASIIEAGALEKILMLISSTPSPPLSEAIVANLLSLSALDHNKPIIGSSAAVPFLINILQNHPQKQSKHDSLRTLFNLSLSPSNAYHLTVHRLVPTLLCTLDDLDLSDRSLAILSNLVCFPNGRLALSSSPDVYPVLIDVLSWTDSPECQEKAAYILMVMAHKAAVVDKTAMLEAGIMSSLLEVMLVGSTLAQKRAARVLECLRVEKGKQVSEGFMDGGNDITMEVGVDDLENGLINDEKRAVKELVRQSLHSNLRRIASRANLQCSFAPSDRFLAMAQTSKSFHF